MSGTTATRGNARQKLFSTDADRELFLSTLSQVVRRLSFRNLSRLKAFIFVSQLRFDQRLA